MSQNACIVKPSNECYMINSMFKAVLLHNKEMGEEMFTNEMKTAKT